MNQKVTPCTHRLLRSIPRLAGTLTRACTAAGQPALCYTESDPSPTVVTSMSALQSAVNSASPGDVILITDNTYTGGTLTFATDGTAENPIVIRPENGIDDVTINSANWTIEGSYIVISGLHFNDARLRLDNSASFNRITRCRFREIGGNAIQLFAATDTRIDHCDFAGYLSNTNGKGCIRLRHTNVGNGTLKRMLVDYNYFHDIQPTTGANGLEPVGQTSSGSGAYLTNPELVIDRCLFRNIDIPNEGEILGAKSNGAIIRFCTFENVRLYLNLPRVGAAWELRSCWFEGGFSPAVNVFSKNNLMIGNRFIGGLNVRIASGDGTWEEIVASGQSTPVPHPRSDSCRIIGNRMGSGHLQVGAYFSGGSPKEKATNNNLYGNTRDSGGDAYTIDSTWSSGTTFNTDNESYVPAVKLTPSDVGLNAPDRLCQ